MFTVYHSNKLEALKVVLVNLIRAEPCQNPFESEQILVQNPGMSQWLKPVIAEELGIVANIKFPLPATFIWDLFTHTLDNVPRRSAFDKEPMTWRLVQLLPKLTFCPDFSFLKKYLENDASDLNLYQLSEKIASVFDSYLVYRPDWISAWEHNSNLASEVDHSHPWQHVLWRELYLLTVRMGKSHYHRANLCRSLITKMGQPSFNKGLLPNKRLFVFGIVALPPSYVSVLHALGQHIDVHFMTTNPCQCYWGDIREQSYLPSWERTRSNISHQDHRVSHWRKETPARSPEKLHMRRAVGNSLLTSLGSLGGDNFSLLSRLQSEEHELFIDVPRDSLLHHIQADVLYLDENLDEQQVLSSHHKSIVQRDDRSLLFHSCYSPLREVEALQDYLLSLFDQHSDLTPREVIVLAVDIQAYGPAIKAVFGSASGNRYIPYTIASRQASREWPVLKLCLQLLNLSNSRCLASELLEILETPIVSKRFSLSGDDLDKVRHWIEDSGIRWGLNRETAERLGLPQTYQNTWEFGIARMMAGYAMGDSVDWLLYNGQRITPYNKIQGVDAELAGKLSLYIEKIRHYREELSRAHFINDWCNIINALILDFFLAGIDGETELHLLRDIVTQLKEQLNEAQYTSPLPCSLLLYYLKKKISEKKARRRFITGQVNFCTLASMHSIPFRIICLLGMNGGEYPRILPVESFNLMAESMRLGDRSRRDDDRYMFLETIVSAQQALYISYTGHSMRDNSSILPSVLVTELLEYCQKNYCLVGDSSLSAEQSAKNMASYLCKKHPMTPYSSLAFSEEMPSYAVEWLPVARRKQKLVFHRAPPVPPPDIPQDKGARSFEIDLDSLQKFWVSPVKYFFNVHLGVSWGGSYPSTPEDTEPFNLDRLNSHRLMRQLVPLLLYEIQANDEPLERLKLRLSASGFLPIGPLGDLDFQLQVERVFPLVEKLRVLFREPLGREKISFFWYDSNKDFNLSGFIGDRYRSGKVFYRLGKIRAIDYLSSWIDHLALATTGNSVPSHILSLDYPKEGVNHQLYPPVERAWAEEQLKLLVSLFFRGSSQPLPYFPRTALAGIEAQYVKGHWVNNPRRMLRKMQSVFTGNKISNGEGQESYISRLWPTWSEELAKEAKWYAEQVLALPMKMVTPS